MTKQRSKRMHGGGVRRARQRRLESAKLFAASGRDVPSPSKPCPTPTKTPYANKPAARAAARRHRDELTRDGQGRLPKPYRCACGRFHLGHLPPVVVRGEAPRSQLRTAP